MIAGPPTMSGDLGLRGPHAFSVSTHHDDVTGVIDIAGIVP